VRDFELGKGSLGFGRDAGTLSRTRTVAELECRAAHHEHPWPDFQDWTCFSAYDFIQNLQPLGSLR